MTAVAEFLLEERARDERLVQSMLAKAISESIQQVTRDPIPDAMALLLLRLAAAQTGNDANEKAGDTALTKAPETTLSRASRHVARAKDIVGRQRDRVVELQAENRPTEEALNMLNIFCQTLASMEHHLRLLREEAEGKDQTPEWLFSRLGARDERVCLSPAA